MSETSAASAPPSRPVGGYDAVLHRYKKHDHLELVFADGTCLREKIKGYNRYTFFLEDGRELHKLELVGVFPREGQDLILQRDHPKVPISERVKERKNAWKIGGVDARFRGSRVRFVLANGWEVAGELKAVEHFCFILRAREHGVMSLYRHGVVDVELLAPPEGKTLEELNAILAEPEPPREPRTETVSSRGAQAPASGVKAPVVSVTGKDLWTALLEKKGERVSVSAKLKMTLRELPPVRGEVGSFFWYALSNEPKGVPAGVTLSPGPLDLLVGKKMVKNAQKKAQALTEAGQPPIYLLEAHVGIQNGRLAAVASSFQVVPGKAPEAAAKE